MNRFLLARKGEAFPATTHYGGESRFQERRVIELPAIALGSENRAHARSLPHNHIQRAAGLSAASAIHRRKFTFRIEPDRHEAFCAAAEQMGISRQELLTRALDAYLKGVHDPSAVHAFDPHTATPTNPEFRTRRPAPGMQFSATR